jgi:outer membrane protein OmpA-like peptidoglycan-associated protein
MAHTLSSTRVRVSVSATGYGSSRILRASRVRGLVAAGVHLVPRGGIFGPGSATPNAAGQRFLRLVARQLHHAHRVTCIGFTAAATSDDIAYRRHLSLQRARAACAYLRRHGVQAQFAVRAAGSTNPAASNASARGRARNRRVELKIRR